MPLVHIDSSVCDACGTCVDECPVQVLTNSGGTIVAIKLEQCMACKYCETVCPNGAIKVEE